MASYINNGRIDINYKKKSDIAIAVGAAVMGVLCLVTGILIDPGSDFDEMRAKTVLVFGALFFGAGFAFFAKRAKEGVTLIFADRRGVTENSTAYSLGQSIPWSHVQGISIEELRGATFIALELNNIDSYLKKLNNRKRKLFEANTEKGYHYVTITTAGTKISLEDLYNDLMELWRKSAGIESPKEE